MYKNNTRKWEKCQQTIEKSKNGVKKRGFSNEKTGTLFAYIISIIKNYRPVIQ